MTRETVTDTPPQQEHSDEVSSLYGCAWVCHCAHETVELSHDERTTFDQLAQGGAPTCVEICSRFSKGRYCVECSLFGKIKSPADLATRNPEPGPAATLEPPGTGTVLDDKLGKAPNLTEPAPARTVPPETARARTIARAPDVVPPEPAQVEERRAPADATVFVTWPPALGEPFDPTPRNGFYPADIVDRQRGLTDAQKRIYARLARLAKGRGWCYASATWLAEALGKSERQVKRDLATLQKRGLLERRRHGRQAGTVRFLWAPLFEGTAAALQQDEPSRSLKGHFGSLEGPSIERQRAVGVTQTR